MLLAVTVSLQQGYSLNTHGLILTLVTGVVIHIIANVFNSYYDWQLGHDQPGDPQVVPLLLNPSLGAPALFRLGIGFLIVGGLLTIILGLLYGNLVFMISLIGIGSAYYYTAPPVTYKNKGWALPAVFTFMGILMPLNTFIVQTQGLALIIIFYSVPLALLVTALLQANELRDYESDAKNNIRSLTVLKGPIFGLGLYKILIYLPYVFTIIFSLLSLFPLSCLFVILTIGKAQTLVRKAENGELKYLDLQTAQLHGIFVIIYILCLLLNTLLS